MSAVPPSITPDVLSVMDEGLATTSAQFDGLLAAYRSDLANTDATVAAYWLATQFLKMPNTPATWIYVIDMLVVAVARLGRAPTPEEML
jgi:hypothetical protein